MALSAARLQANILNSLKSFWGVKPPQPNPEGIYWWLNQLAGAIAQNVITEIKDNGHAIGVQTGGSDVPIE